MERLTRYTDTGIPLPDWEMRKNGHTRCIQKLAEYEDLEEQGKLLRLTVKVGDTVYIKGCPVTVTFLHIEEDIHYCCQWDCDKCPCPIYAKVVSREGEVDCGINGYIEFTKKDIGKTVFLSNKEDKQ